MLASGFLMVRGYMVGVSRPSPWNTTMPEGGCLLCSTPWGPTNEPLRGRIQHHFPVPQFGNEQSTHASVMVMIKPFPWVSQRCQRVQGQCFYHRGKEMMKPLKSLPQRGTSTSAPDKWHVAMTAFIPAFSPIPS